MALRLLPFGSQARTVLRQGGIVALPPGHLFGLTLSNDGTSPNTVIDIAAGSCRDTSDTDNMVLAAFTKSTGGWASGTGHGGLDTGAVAASTWYHVYVIKQPGGLAGATDALISTSATAPTMPSGYTLKRRIGSFLTDGSSHIVTFKQDGDRFRWTTGVVDVNSTNPGTSAVTAAISTPLGVKTWADLIVNLNNATTALINGLVTSLDETDRAPSGTEHNFLATGATGGRSATSLLIKTDTSSQVRYRLSASGASDIIFIETFGWVDQRGRLF